MRQLDTCDFCGDAAEGVYEVVPASVTGDSRRLALCADCRTTLQSVVDPLLDAVDSGSATSAAASTDDDTDAAAATTATADDDSNDATDDSAASAASSTATSDDADSEGVTIEVGGSEETGTEAEDGDGGAEAADDDGGDDAAGDDAAGESRARRPSGYAQLIRLLQNRDGAMAREDLRALATNAYDLGGPEFETALEAAVENGDIQETADGLRTA